MLGMHHHRLVLNGPTRSLPPLVDELRRAGATVLDADGPPRLVWSTSDPRLVERLARRHAEVAVGVERFEALGTEMVRLVVHGADTTILDRRRVLPHPDDDLEGWGGCDDEGVQLDPELLRRAARRVQERVGRDAVTRVAVPAGRDADPDGEAGHEGPPPPGPPLAALGAALALGTAFGAVCAAAPEPAVAGGPDPRCLDAIADLAATALTAGAALCAPTPAPAEAVLERAWALTRALARAGDEPLWEGPGTASWPEWLGYLAAATADALLACVEGGDAVGTAIASVHREHCATPAEHRAIAAGALVATGLQMLALFDAEIR